MFDRYPGYLFTGLDEYIGYQHAKIRTSAGAAVQDPTLTVDYDPHYCRALISKSSNWNLNIADWLRPSLRSSQVWVDGKNRGFVKDETTVIDFSAGSEKHTLELHTQK